MEKKQLIISSALLLVAGISTSASAALATGSTLNFNPGVESITFSGETEVESGSYFGMDRSGNGSISPVEKIALVQNDGLFIGATQAASGSHTGSPNGLESPGIDKPWNFVGNTGMSFSRAGVLHGIMSSLFPWAVVPGSQALQMVLPRSVVA